eukprot:2328438-Pleurochrysis_carterae.AAC.1
MAFSITLAIRAWAAYPDVEFAGSEEQGHSGVSDQVGGEIRGVGEGKRASWFSAKTQLVS